MKWYEPDAGYRVEAKWTPYNPPKVVTLVTLAGTDDPQPMPGVAEFKLSGVTYRLEPVMEANRPDRLFFILRDTTSTSTTYGACRFLYTALPSNGVTQEGELLLDFNHLENPPCAYTPVLDVPASAAGESPAHRAARRRAALSRIGRNGTMTLEGSTDAVDRGKLTELRTVLLRLHKTLLDMERREYEREHGHVSTGELFRLVIDHQQFGWLHNISEFVVRLDETLAGEAPITAEDLRSAVGMARKMFVPSESGDAFQKRYFDAIQRDPAVVMEHAELARLFNSEPADAGAA